MANRNDFNKHGSKSPSVDQFYMVDSTRVFNMDVYEGAIKERQMITQICLWLWWGAGAPAWVLSMLAFVFGWIHIGDVKSFITLSIAVITSVSKVIIMWAEKGDIVKEKCKKVFTKLKSKFR